MMGKIIMGTYKIIIGKIVLGTCKIMMVQKLMQDMDPQWEIMGTSWGNHGNAWGATL
jgi:hypothetical protein